MLFLINLKCIGGSMIFKSLLFSLLIGLPSVSVQSGIPTDSSAIATVLFRQQKAWNEGDIRGYMDGYWKSDSLRFVWKSGITTGWGKTLHNYEKSYPDKTAMGILNFEIVSLDLMNSTGAFMLGKWHLTRVAGDLSGYFTLLWRKIDGAWVIVLDHSS